jgi:hypothetical protein
VVRERLSHDLGLISATVFILLGIAQSAWAEQGAEHSEQREELSLVIGQSSLVNRQPSLVIGHESLVMSHWLLVVTIYK